jgi:flavin-binding protein dodecin
MGGHNRDSTQKRALPLWVYRVQFCAGASRPGLRPVAAIGELAARRSDRLAATARTGSQIIKKEKGMSVYRVTEIIGTSSTSWEDAAAEAIRTAAGTLRDLRVAEVVRQDIHLDEGGAITYRTKLQLSFKYEPEH